MFQLLILLGFSLITFATMPDHLLLAQANVAVVTNLSLGPYQVRPTLNLSACMDLDRSISTNGTAIQSYSCNGTNAQSWTLVPIAGSSGSGYQVISTSSGSCLDVSGVSLSDGALVHEWQCLGASQPNQIWQFIAFGTAYELMSVSSGKCLDLPSGDSSNGTQLQQWSCGAGTNKNQLWNLVPGANASTASDGEQAGQAQVFFDSMGIETKLSYLNSAFGTEWPIVFAKLKSLGIRHVRDGYYYWPASSSIVANHQSLAAAGIFTTYVVPLDHTSTVAEVQETSSNVQDMEALEATNECDINVICGSPSIVGINNVVSFLPTLSAAGRALGIPVLGPSFTTSGAYVSAGNLAALINFNNLHVYFGGRNPGSNGWGGGDAQGNSYGSFAWWMDQGAFDAPGVPDIITETGYYMASKPSPYQITESVAASYIPRTYLLAFNHGIQRTFVHELIDEDASPYFGLLRYDLSERPAFTAVKNLVSLVGDPGVSFNPAKLNYTVSGDDLTLNHTLLQKRDGTFLLMMWLERSSYDEIHNVATPVTPQAVTLTLNEQATIKKISQFDITGNLSDVAVSGSSTTVPITISDQVTVVQITPQ